MPQWELRGGSGGVCHRQRAAGEQNAAGEERGTAKINRGAPGKVPGNFRLRGVDPGVRWQEFHFQGNGIGDEGARVISEALVASKGGWGWGGGGDNDS